MLRGLPFAVANRSGKIRFVRDDLTLPGGCAGAITARRPLQFRDRVRYRAGRRAVGRKPPFSRVAAARAFSGGHRALDGAGAGQFRMRGAKLGAPPSLCRRGDPIMLAASPGARGDKTRQARAAREESSRLDPETPRRDLGISSAAPRLFKATATSSRREGSP